MHFFSCPYTVVFKRKTAFTTCSLVLLTLCWTAFHLSFLSRLFSSRAGPQKCSACWMLLLQGCTSWLGNSSSQRWGGEVYRGVSWGFCCFVVLILIWRKKSLYTRDLILISSYLLGQLLTLLHVRGTWLHSMPRLCVYAFVGGEVFACQQQIMLHIHSKTDLFFSL